MINLEENKDVIIVTRENKLRLFYDMFGLLSFIVLGLVLINPRIVSTIEYNDLISGWFTASLGSFFCLLMLFSQDHTSRWIFDKISSHLVVEHKRINGSRHFEFPLERIKSIQVTYLSDGGAEIIFPDTSPAPISIGTIPTDRVDIYVRVIKKFLDLND